MTNHMKRGDGLFDDHGDAIFGGQSRDGDPITSRNAGRSFNAKGGLLTLPIPEQQQVRDAMSPELVRMVFKTKARARNE